MNAFKKSELVPLLKELALENASLKYFDGGDLKGELEKVRAFIVINPLLNFTQEEVETVKDFVENDGNLVMVTDPTRSGVNFINSLSKNFHTIFSPGYLYNMENHYGLYRNIYLENFENENIFQGVKRTLLFTTTNIVTPKGGIAHTSPTHRPQPTYQRAKPKILTLPSHW